MTFIGKILEMHLKSLVFATILTLSTPLAAQETVPVLESDNSVGQEKLDPQSFEVALLCSAALQITTLAAPQWANQPAIVDASNAWLARVQFLAPQNGIPGDKINDVIKVKMRELTNASLQNAEYLNNLAFECAVNSPS